MRLIAAIAIALVCLVWAPSASQADQGPYPQTEAEKEAAYNALQWQNAASDYKLPRSQSVIKLPSGYYVLLGADAARYSWLASGIEFPDTEAVLARDSEADNSLVYYEWRDEGYVSDSDWEDVNAEDLLNSYREGTEEANKEREAIGRKPMHVVGWLEQPTYDKSTKTVTYALELGDDTNTWVNAVALRLGRRGYTEFTWVGSVDAFKSSGSRPALMNDALAMHAFEEGARYADYTEGDKVAAYGIAGLVATAVGVKFGKGIIAALIAALIAGKKIIIPVVLVAAAALYKFGGRLFRRGDS